MKNNLIIGIDPGRNTGIAVLKNGEPVQLSVVTLKSKNLNEMSAELSYNLEKVIDANIRGISLGVIEMPVIYSRMQNPGNPNDILKVGFLVGVASAFFTWSILPTPRDWKGSMPKNINHKRTLTRAGLKALDLLHCIPKSKQEHAIDALGIAFWAWEKGK
jgi:Holliday junction resolvasome RuvABC endonuclease subunit